jgi:hypothetical protein
MTRGAFKIDIMRSGAEFASLNDVTSLGQFRVTTLEQMEAKKNKILNRLGLEAATQSKKKRREIKKATGDLARIGLLQHHQEAEDARWDHVDYLEYKYD